MKVKECMSASPVFAAPEDSAASAARLMQKHNIGSLPVVGADGTLLGIVTDRDLCLRCLAAEKDRSHSAVARLMSVGVRSVTPEDEVDAAASEMARAQVRRLPVVNGGKLVGMVSLGDLAGCRESASCLSEISKNCISL